MRVELSSGLSDRKVARQAAFLKSPLHPQALSTLLEISSKETQDEISPWNLP